MPGSPSTTLTHSSELILWFHKAREDHVLTLHELWLYKCLKLSYLGYASLERTITRQHARIASLKDGDANTTFFHSQCSYRRHKKRVNSLYVADQVLTEPNEMMAATFAHFEGLIGTTVEWDRTLNLAHLIDPSADLQELDEPFTEEEVWTKSNDSLHEKRLAQMGSSLNFCRLVGES
jgi:hypothetical protein